MEICRRLLVLMLAAMLLAIVSNSPASAAEPPQAPWWNKDWKYRKAVRLNFPKNANDLPVNFFDTTQLFGERWMTGKADITVEGDPAQLSKNIAVTDAKGERVPARAYGKGWGHEVTILFRAEPKTADYFIYYGNPKPEHPLKTWQTSASPIQTATVPVSGPGEIEEPARAAQAVLDAWHNKLKTTELRSVGGLVQPSGPLKAGTDYITVYSGLLFAPATGTYEFALDVGGTAHLLVDGSTLLTAQGSAPGQSWRSKAQVKLDEGMHTFTILHGENTRTQGIRLGWRTPDSRNVAPLYGEALGHGNRLPAEIIGMDELGKPVTPFFTVKSSDVAFEVEKDGKAAVAIELNNLTRGEGLTYSWTIGRTSSSSRSPKCFVPADAECKIALQVARGKELIGSYERTVNFETVRRVKAAASIELIRCPNVIYEGDGSRAAFKVTNTSESPLPLLYEQSDTGVTGAPKHIELSPRDEQSVDIELPVPPSGQSSADVLFRLWLAETKLGEAAVRVVRPEPGILAGLTPALGHLTDRDGRRVVIAARLESETEHRRWASIKWIARQLETGPKNVLLFGDPMLNLGENPAIRSSLRSRSLPATSWAGLPAEAGDGFGGVGQANAAASPPVLNEAEGPNGSSKSYAEFLQTRLAAGGVTFTFVQSSADAVAPCVADIPAFASALARYTPDFVIISPGSRDAIKGIARQELARCLDVLIDLVRSQKKPPALIIVSPPPLVSSPAASEEMASAVRAIAQQHHVPLVDLHSLLTAKKNWERLYKIDADDEVYYLYPNAETQKQFADAIFDAIK